MTALRFEDAITSTLSSHAGMSKRKSFHRVDPSVQSGVDASHNDDDDARFDDSRSQLLLTSLRARKAMRKEKRHRKATAATVALKAKEIKAVQAEKAHLAAENKRLRLALQQQQQQQQQSSSSSSSVVQQPSKKQKNAQQPRSNASEVPRVKSSADVNRLMDTMRTPEDAELERLAKLIGDEDLADLEEDGLGDLLALVDDPTSERSRKVVAEVDSDTDSEELRQLDAARDEWSGEEADLLSQDDFEEAEEIQYDDDDDDEDEHDDDDGGEEDDEADDQEEQEEEEEEEQKAEPAPTASSATKYVPPHLRRKSQSEVDELRLRVKRLLNMLAPTNLVAIVKDMEQVFASNSRNLTTEALGAEVQSLCQSTSLSPLLASAFAALLVAMSTLVAFEVLSTIVEEQAQRLHAAERREASNVALLWACLYRMRSLSSAMVSSVLAELVGRFDEQSIELAMLLVRNCGAHLRRDDPQAFKSVVDVVTARRGENLGSRGEFLVDTIIELKENRKRQAEPLEELVTPLRKQLAAIFVARSAKQPAALRALWSDLLDAPTKGRWWLVGSAWVGQVADGPASAEDETLARRITATQFSNELLELAKKQRMNTDVRRVVFCTMMDSDDYVDAFERLSKLGLRSKDQRELLHVLLHCAARERVYNPFYAHLAERLSSENGKAFRSALQFALWDKLRNVAALSATSTANLAQLFATLLAAGCFKMKLLRVVEWLMLDAPTLLFLRTFFRTLLAELSPAAVERVFGQVRDRSLREGVLHFLTGDFRLYMHRVLSDAEQANAALVASLDAARKQLRFAVSVLKNSRNADDSDDAE
jgi:nucleolar MIF4G domain-containing protein 1